VICCLSCLVDQPGDSPTYSTEAAKTRSPKSLERISMASNTAAFLQKASALVGDDDRGIGEGHWGERRKKGRRTVHPTPKMHVYSQPSLALRSFKAIETTPPVFSADATDEPLKSYQSSNAPVLSSSSNLDAGATTYSLGSKLFTSGGVTRPLPPLPPEQKQQNPCPRFVQDSGLHPHLEEREWSSVTVDEAKQIEEDVRGVGSDEAKTIGTPALTEDDRETSLLPSLEAELDALPATEAATYWKARSICPDLVDDEEKKAFLWKENYNPKLAAKRIARHWQYKLELFGAEKCFRPMTLSGALSDDIVALSTGFIQLLPDKDEHGRTVLFMAPGHHDMNKCCRESVIRALWYILHIATRDPEARRRGIVLVMDGRNYTQNPFDPPLYKALLNLGFKYMAVMLRCIHYCHPGHLFHIILPVIKMLAGERLRKRLLVHYGQTEDVLRSLDDLGLSPDLLPTEIGGNVKLDRVKWLTDRMMSEALSPKAVRSLPEESGVARARDLPSQQLSTHLFDSESMFAPFCSYRVEAIDTLISARVEQPLCADMNNSAPFVDVSHTRGSYSETNKPSQELSTSINEPESAVAPLYGNGAEDYDTLFSPWVDSHTLDQSSTADSVPHSVTDKTSCDVTECARVESKFVTEKSLPHCPDVAPTSLADNLVAHANRTDTGDNSKKPKTTGDHRMTLAIEAKTNNPKMSLLDALIVGGFDFPPRKEKGKNDKQIRDSDNVTLFQRKNQLSRRLRGRRMGDPRMSLAVAAKLERPGLSMVEALLAGGFVFPNLNEHALCDRKVRDTENVTLFSRKKELGKKLQELERIGCINAKDSTSTGGL